MQLGQMGGFVINSPRCNTQITCRVCAHCVNLCPVNIGYYIPTGWFQQGERMLSVKEDKWLENIVPILLDVYSSV